MREYANQYFDAIWNSDVFWLLVPASKSEDGCAELGHAIALRKEHGNMRVFVSGEHLRRPLFTSLADEQHERHENAFEFVIGHFTWRNHLIAEDPRD